MRQRQPDGKGADTISLGLALLSHLFNEWNAVLAIHFLDGPHRDVLAISAMHGFGGYQAA